MSLKNSQKYVIIFVACLIVVTPFFCDISPTTIQNETVYIPFVGLKITNIGAYVALIVGILAFIGTIYNTDKTYKAMKLSAIPDNSVNLLIDLEFKFNEFEVYKLKGEGDEFILLIQILKFWKDHQKAFRLLTPNFYKSFIKFISNPEKICEDDEIYEINAKYIMNAILTQFTNIALENDDCPFYFIKPNKITDDSNIKYIGDLKIVYTEFNINKINFNKYINDIHGQKTKEITFKKYGLLENDVKSLINTLKSEIEEYNQLNNYFKVIVVKMFYNDKEIRFGYEDILSRNDFAKKLADNIIDYKN